MGIVELYYLSALYLEGHLHFEEHVALNDVKTSCFKPLYQRKAWLYNHPYGNEFNLPANEDSFSYGRMETKTRFD